MSGSASKAVTTQKKNLMPTTLFVDAGHFAD